MADADGVRGFVRNDTGGLTALDLATGQPLWTSKLDAWPLAVRGGRVLVQTRDKANVLRIVGLDADKGDKVWEPIHHAAGLGVGRSRPLGRLLVQRLHAPGRERSASELAGGHVVLGRGCAVPQTEKAARHNADGVARIDLDSGKVELLDKAPPPPAAASARSRWRRRPPRCFLGRRTPWVGSAWWAISA